MVFMDVLGIHFKKPNTSSLADSTKVHADATTIQCRWHFGTKQRAPMTYHSKTIPKWQVLF